MNRQVTVAEVTGEGFLRNSQNTVLKGIVLVLKKSDRPLQLFRPQTTKLKRPLPEGTYDRMVIIGQWNSKDCFVVISASAQKSAKLFSDRHLTVGSVVEVTEPIYSNTCLGNDRNNPIIESHQAIVVINNVTNKDFPPIPIISLPSTPAISTTLWTIEICCFCMETLYLLPVLEVCATVVFSEMKRCALAYRRTQFRRGLSPHASFLETWKRKRTIPWAETWHRVISWHRFFVAMMFFGCQLARLNWICCVNQ